MQFILHQMESDVTSSGPVHLKRVSLLREYTGFIEHGVRLSQAPSKNASLNADSPNADHLEDEHELPLAVVNMLQSLFGVLIERMYQIENLATTDEVTDRSTPATNLKNVKP